MKIGLLVVKIYPKEVILGGSIIKSTKMLQMQKCLGCFNMLPREMAH